MGVIDIAKFQKNLSKSMDTVSIGFSNPDTWIDSGNFGLNFRISGNFKKGFPLEGKMTLLAGESGSGKSYISSGHVVKWCQQNGILPIIIDTENALDEDWVRALGVDPNGYIVKVKASLIDDIAKIMADFIKDYKSQYGSVVYNEKPRVLFIIDSLGMAITPTESDQFEKGDMKGDLGRKQKQLYSLCRNFLNSCGSEPIGLLCTQHTYASQDIFSPDAVIAGGCLVADTKVQTTKGLCNIQDIKIGDEVQTLFGNQKVLNTFHYNKPIISLYLEDGSQVKCSEEHKFLVNDDNNLIWKTANDLLENDEIIYVDIL